MFSIKEVANSLQISTQAIYKQKDELIKRGYMEKNTSNQWEINNNGFNYLRDKKINYIQQHNNQNIQPVANQKENEKEEKMVNSEYINNLEVANITIQHYKEQLQTITNQLQEIKEQRDYFKMKYEEKDNLCNQYMNSHLLEPIEEERERLKIENKNKGFFSRLFGK